MISRGQAEQQRNICQTASSPMKAQHDKNIYNVKPLKETEW